MQQLSNTGYVQPKKQQLDNLQSRDWFTVSVNSPWKVYLADVLVTYIGKKKKKKHNLIIVCVLSGFSGFKSLFSICLQFSNLLMNMVMMFLSCDVL